MERRSILGSIVLTILNAKTFGFTNYKEPEINKFILLKHYQNMAPRVEDDDGVTLLSVFSAVDFNEMIARARKVGMVVNSLNPELLEELLNSGPCCTYLMLITNNVFIETRNKSYSDQCVHVMEIGFEVPNFLDYIEAL